MPSDLRKESRIRSRGPVQLWIGNQKHIPANIRDVSVCGICVETEVEVALGISVYIVGTGFHGAAMVRHCSACGPLFRLGLELVPPASMADPARVGGENTRGLDHSPGLVG